MCKRILIIEKESEEQTLESVIALPLKVQIELSLYVISTKEMCDVINVAKGFMKQPNNTILDYKEIYKALTDENNFVIPYISKH